MHIRAGTNEFRLARRLCNEWDRRGIRIIRVMYGCIDILCMYIVLCLIRYIIIRLRRIP